MEGDWRETMTPSQTTAHLAAMYKAVGEILYFFNNMEEKRKSMNPPKEFTSQVMTQRNWKELDRLTERVRCNFVVAKEGIKL